MMQGVAIIIMIFFHVFEPHLNTDYAGTLLGNIARTQNPVSFYLVLSGYGMYIVTHRSQPDLHKFSRIGKLFLKYWIITSVFVFISRLLGDSRCNLSFSEIVLNLTGLSSTYNLVTWFLLPYAMLSLSSPFLFKIMDRRGGTVISLFLGFAIYGFSAYMNRYAWFRSNLFQYFYIMLPFLLGGVICKENVVEKLRDVMSTSNRWLPCLLLFVLIVVRYFIPSGAFAAIYAATFILLIVVAHRPMFLNYALKAFGYHSLNMWMIHFWIRWYMFKEQISQINNSLLEFLTVFVSSYILSYCFNLLFKSFSRVFGLALSSRRN